MIRRFVRAVAVLGVLGGLGFALVKLVQGRRSTQPRLPSGEEPLVPKRSETPLVEPKMLHNVSRKVTDRAEPPDEETPSPRLIGAQAPPAASRARAAAPASEAAATDEAGTGAAAQAGPKVWVDPDGAICPTSHPVKAKLASGIFHLPGMLAYDRTTPDRCYPSGEAAEADGLRQAKR